MFEKKRTIIGLETGTAKIRVAVGEQSNSGALNIVHVSEVDSNGVVKGEVVNAGAALEDLRNALADAEDQANVEISHVILGVTGRHVSGFNNRGVKMIPSVDREITEEDVEDVLKDARAVSLPNGNCMIHCIRQNFNVDDRTNLPSPVGICGSRLESYLHVVHGNKDRTQTTIKLLKQLELGVDEMAFTGLASAMSLLEPEHKELGALVIDLGAGTTEFVVYANRIIKHTGVVAVGGHNVTNDLALGLRVSQVQAEQLKIKHGEAIADDSCKGQILTLPTDVGLPARTVNLEHLRRIQAQRLTELFEIIADALTENDLWECLGAGVFLCGGGSRTPRIQELAGKVFQLPVAVGKSSLSGPTSVTSVPEFQAAIGLVRFGASQRARRSSGDSFMERLAEPLKAISSWRNPVKAR